MPTGPDWQRIPPRGAGYGTSDYLAPSWQEALSHSASRQVPDISFLARDGFADIGGSATEVDGTSHGAPSWAAIWALLKEAGATASAPAAGDVAPEILYTLTTSCVALATPAFFEEAPGKADTLSPEIGLGVPNVQTLASDFLAVY